MKKDADPFIWEKKNSLSEKFCDTLVERFEEDIENRRYRGVTGIGVNLDLKNTWDLAIEGEYWKEIDDTICNILNESVQEYLDTLKEINPVVFPFRKGYEPTDSGYILQKYEPNTGFYTWHDDYRFDKERGGRVLTFLWYLNTVMVGGETEFAIGRKVKAEKGKLLIFPSNWNYVHRGCMPYSSEKHILTGWIYNGWNE